MHAPKYPHAYPQLDSQGLHHLRRDLQGGHCERGDEHGRYLAGVSSTDCMNSQINKLKRARSCREKANKASTKYPNIYNRVIE